MIETALPRGMVGPRLLPGSSLRAGDLLGARYRVEVLIHGGRASARFLGRDTKTATPIAIEIVMGASDEADAVGVRFLASARRAANLATSHVARVLDAGVTNDGHPYVVTEALSSETIAKALELRGSAPTAEAIDITLDVCEALAEAHASGLLHGDLTTESIQIAPEVKVVGIGTTHATLGLLAEEELGIRAPERLDPANPIDARTDVWGVGVVLYTMLAGASPFASDSPSSQNVSLALDEPPQLAGVPDALADVVDSCLAKNPVLRPHTIKRLAEELAPFASDPEAAAARIAEWEEVAPQSSPTLVTVVYDALRKEKQEAMLTDADSTAPRTALAKEALRHEGAVDVSDPRLEVVVDMEPSVRDVMKSEPPPAVSRTLPPPREMPTVTTRRPRRWKLGMHPMTIVGASACMIVATIIAAGIIRGEGDRTPTAAAAAAAAGEIAPPPPSPEPREAPPPSVATAPETTTVVAATALPAATAQAAAPPAMAPKHVVTKKAAPAAPTADKPQTQTQTQRPAPEPKASDDDLRKFLDDRR